MTRGRKPKPTHLKVIEGNPGKRRLPVTEPKPPPSRPRAPAHMPEAAKAIWRDLVPRLDELGVLTRVDRYTLEVLCVAVAQFREASQIVAKSGLLVKGARTGEAVRNPALIEARQAAKLIATYSAMFGLSPADRVRLAGEPGVPGGTIDLDALLES